MGEEGRRKEDSVGLEGIEVILSVDDNKQRDFKCPPNFKQQYTGDTVGYLGRSYYRGSLVDLIDWLFPKKSLSWIDETIGGVFVPPPDKDNALDKVWNEFLKENPPKEYEGFSLMARLGQLYSQIEMIDKARMNAMQLGIKPEEKVVFTKDGDFVTYDGEVDQPTIVEKKG